MYTTRQRFLRLVLIGTGLLTPACARAPKADRLPTPFPLRGQSSDIAAGVDRIRAATARYASLDSAVADGYRRDVAQCYANGPEGAMGYHHVNRGYVDDSLELEKPEILIYERHPDGRYTLNAVEFIIPFARRPADAVPPVLLGQALKPYADLRIWSIHVWAWKENPSGLFADWNPAVHCLGTPTTMSH